MKINLDTYIISDTHFGHKNIVKYCDRPEDHDNVMLKNWWRIVTIDDEVLHLGDLTFKSNYVGFSQLPGHKYLMLGNHDHKSHDWYEDHGFTVVPKRMYYHHKDKVILFSHYPETRLDIPWHINIHGHVHNNAPQYTTREGRLRINVSVEVMDYTPVKLRDILMGGKVL